MGSSPKGMNSMKARRLNITPVFTATLGWLAAGGVDELRKSLGRQWVQRIGALIGIVSVFGLWGVDITLFSTNIVFYLTMAEFQATMIVVGGMVVLDLIGSFMALRDDRARRVDDGYARRGDVVEVKS
jgi:hypothetical protein